MKKNYFVLNADDEHEYTITKEDTNDGTLTKLYRSESTNSWTEEARGEFILSMLDDGNGAKFSKKMKKMDYAELFELRLLLTFDNKTDVELNRDSYTVIEPNIIFEA